MSRRSDIVKFLKDNAGQYFSAGDLAEWWIGAHPDAVHKKVAKSKQDLSSENSVRSQVAAEIYTDKEYLKDQGFTVTAGRPQKFSWLGDSSQPVIAPKSDAKGQSEREENLYAPFVEYLKHEHGVEGMRIREGTGSNNKGPGGNKWLYPDIVGYQDLRKKFNKKVAKLASEYGDEKLRFWSFEIKKDLTRGNVREYFFQAVSNSSWADYGYLVATNIPDNVMDELKILTARHGIGVINFDPDNFANSIVVFQAELNMQADFATINRIACEGGDFMLFVDKALRVYRNEDID